jgi:hypothetical protein
MGCLDMPANPPIQSIIIMECKGSSIVSHIIFEPTAEQTAALERIGWALFGDSQPDRPSSVVLAAVAVALDQPGPFLEKVRAGLQADGNFLQCFRAKAPAKKMADASGIEPIKPV